MKTIDGIYLSRIRESEVSQLISQNGATQHNNSAEQSTAFWQLFDHKTYGSKLGGKTTRKRKKEKKKKFAEYIKMWLKLLMSWNSFKTFFKTINHKKHASSIA